MVFFDGRLGGDGFFFDFRGFFGCHDFTTNFQKNIVKNIDIIPVYIGNMETK